MIAVTARIIKRYSHVNWTLADQTMVSGVNFLTGILLARYLGIEEFGVFTLAWMAVLFVNSLQMAMIISPMMSIGSKRTEEEVPSYYGAMFVQQAVFAVVSFIVLFSGVRLSGVFFPQWNVQHLALPLATVTLVFQMQDFMRRYFFTRNRAKVAFLSDAIRYLGQMGLLIWLFQVIEMDSADALWIISGTSMAAVFLGLFSLERMAWNRGTLITITNRHWQFSKWLTGSALMQWTSGNFFIVVVGGMLGATAVGALRAAQNVMGVMHILFQGLENIVPVRAGNYYHQSGSQALVAYLRKVAWVGGLSTVIIALLVAAIPEIWLGLFYGNEFISYGNLLRWYAVVYVLMFFGFVLRVGLRALETTRPIFYAYLLATIVTLSLAHVLIEWRGLNGAAFGILLTQIVMVAVFTFSLLQKLKFASQEEDKP